MADAVQLRALDPGDLAIVAAIHLRAFPASALTALGKGAVERYYAWQLNGPHDVVALGASIDARLVGFCFGGVFRGALSGFVRANRAFLIRRVLSHPWLLLNPIFRERLGMGIRVSNILRRRRSTPPPASAVSPIRSFGILAIAVDPALHNRGIGKVLLQEAELRAVRMQFTTMGLSVNADNQQAIGFYERLGWRKEPAGAAWAGRMTKHIQSTL